MFSPELMAEIHRRSQGIPRVINAICDNLLLTAFAMESTWPTWPCSTKSARTCAWSGRAGECAGAGPWAEQSSLSTRGGLIRVSPSVPHLTLGR